MAYEKTEKIGSGVTVTYWVTSKCSLDQTKMEMIHIVNGYLDKNSYSLGLSPIVQEEYHYPYNVNADCSKTATDCVNMLEAKQVAKK